MAGRGMGAAVRGGGAVGSGPKNKMLSEPSMKTGKVVMAKDGGMMNQHKRMAMGMMGGGSPVRGYRRGSGQSGVQAGGLGKMYGGLPNQQPVKRKKGGMAKKVKKMRKGGAC